MNEEIASGAGTRSLGATLVLLRQLSEKRKKSEEVKSNDDDQEKENCDTEAATVQI